MRTDRIATAWKSFSDATLPWNASAEQRKDMRNAFFAGALSYFVEMNKIAVNDGEPTAAEVDEIEGLYRELIAHGSAINTRPQQ